jgi:predicted PurR-regulated permease PerM
MLPATPGPTGEPPPRIDWTRWRDIPLALIAWAALVLLVLWLVSYVIQSILILTIAALISYALIPAIRFLERYVPRFLAVIVVYIIFLGSLGTLLYFVASTAITELKSLGDFLKTALTSANGQPSPLETRLMGIGLPRDQIEAVGNQIVNRTEAVVSTIVPVAIGIFTTALDIVVVIVLSIYLSFDGARVRDWLLNKTPVRQRERIHFIQETLDHVMAGYIRGQVLLALLISFIVGVILSWLHVPFAVLLSIFVFVLEFIPILGSLISGTFCVLIALTVSWEVATLTLIAFVIIHMVDAYVLSPRIVGRSIGLHPIVAITALTAGAELFGIWGALLAGPITGVIQALLIAIWQEWRQANPHEFIVPHLIPEKRPMNSVTEDEEEYIKQRARSGQDVSKR